MRRYLPDPEIESLLTHLESLLLRSGKAKTNAIPEVKHYLSRILSEIRHSPISYRMMGPEIQEKLYVLLRKSERARTADELQDLLRDVRQYLITINSISQSQEMNERMEELESQIKAISDKSENIQDGDQKVITLEVLKDKRVLFTIMPYLEDLTDVWIGGIQRAANGTGLYPVRIDMITKSSEITDDIVAAIEMAEVVVVDVTHNNPNVMFEFGFALARNKPHIIISQSAEFLTFDIKNVRTLLYQNTWQGIEKLHKDLQTFIKGTVVEKTKKKK